MMASATRPDSGVDRSAGSGGDCGVIDLLDGVRVSYRPIRAEDAAALQRFHLRLSRRSVYLRFFGAKPELSDRKAGYFARLDGVNQFALVALDPDRPGEIVAIVSYYREGSSDRAEYAAVVEDGWQGRGLGLELTRRLIQAALKRGVACFTGVVLPENARMLSLLRDLNLPEHLRLGDGLEYVEIELAPTTKKHPSMTPSLESGGGIRCLEIP
ncbi:MAG TPA: GNAT family N-acetyltransferase [Rubrobacteraceae bacterium]|nr:GNAT family N-acetyltransferase [Rubrobacteraceae bacterium]